MQKLTEEMKVRINAIVALEKAILPRFCKEMECNNTCPMRIDKDNPDVNQNCAWCNVINAISVLSWRLHE